MIGRRPDATQPDLKEPDLMKRSLTRSILGGALLITSLVAGEAPKFPPLTTVSGSPRLVGKFIWADLVTDDVAAARKFYGALFGWTWLDYGGDYDHDDIVVTPPGGLERPVHPEQPIARPSTPRPTPMPSIPSTPRPVARPSGRR